MNTVKLISNNDFSNVINITRNAYPAMKLNTEEKIEKSIKKAQKLQQKEESKNYYGAYREDKLLGVMLLHDYEMNFSSEVIKAGGVGSVAVNLLHKKEKVAKDMIRFYLDHYKERETYMAILYPFRPDFYKKMGFGFGTKMNQYKVKPSELPRLCLKDNIYYPSKDDSEALLECYNRFFEKNHGMIKKDLSEIEKLFDNPENRIVAYKRNGKVKGYIVFNFKKNHGDSFLINDIHINEFIYENREVLLEFMTFLNTQDDQIRNIIFNTQDEYFHYLLSNPNNGTNNIIPSVYHECNTQGVGIMYRVIDVKGIFQNLSNHKFGDENLKLKLKIKDSFLKENQGDYVVHFKDGFPEAMDSGDYEVEISLDISDFSSLLMGVVNFKSLYKYGMANISNESYMNKVNKLFFKEEKPVCTTAF